MASDNLIALIESIRHEFADVPDEAFERIMAAIRREAGGSKVYVPASRNKRTHLEIIAEAGNDLSARQLSKILGLSVRRVYELKKLV